MGVFVFIGVYWCSIFGREGGNGLYCILGWAGGCIGRGCWNDLRGALGLAGCHLGHAVLGIIY